MKTNLIIILIVIILGIGMTGYSYTQLIKVDAKDNEYIVKSLSKLKKLEKDVDVLMLRSRYGLDRNYDDLSKVPNYISAKYEDLREGTTRFQNASFKKLLDDYGKNNIIRAEIIENFKTHNSLYRNAAIYAPEVGNYLFDFAMDTPSVRSYAVQIKVINNAVYDLILKSDRSSKRIIESGLIELRPLENLVEGNTRTKLFEYMVHLKTLVDEKSQTDSYISKASSLPTENLLDKIEVDYTSFYNDAMEKNSNVWTYLIGYMIASMILLTFLGVRIFMSGNNSKLDQHTAKTIVGRVGRIADNIDGVIGDFASMQGLFNNIKKVDAYMRTRDMKKLGGQLKSLVKEYDQLQQDDTMVEMNLKLYSSKDNVEDLQSKLEA